MNTCTRCGAEIVRNGAAGAVCPACVLRLALESASDAPPAAFELELSRLLGPIGRGPHGTTYLGYRRFDEPRFVTIKLIEDRIDVDRFSDGIRRIASRLKSATPLNAPVFLEPGVTTDGHPYVASTFIPGTPIGHYGKRVDTNEAFGLAIQLCTLVANLHAAGIVHGSIKPSNVIVADSAGGHVPVLLDTGVTPAIIAAQTPAGRELVLDVRQDVRALSGLIADLLHRAGVGHAGALDRCQSTADLSSRLAALRSV
jgi:serine/threonine protein kinase